MKNLLRLILHKSARLRKLKILDVCRFVCVCVWAHIDNLIEISYSGLHCNVLIRQFADGSRDYAKTTATKAKTPRNIAALL